METQNGIDPVAAWRMLKRLGLVGLGGLVIWGLSQGPLTPPVAVDHPDHNHVAESPSAPPPPENCRIANGSAVTATGGDECYWDATGQAWRVVHP
jgi:hypothetical protein